MHTGWTDAEWSAWLEVASQDDVHLPDYEDYELVEEEEEGEEVQAPGQENMAGRAERDEPAGGSADIRGDEQARLEVPTASDSFAFAPMPASGSRERALRPDPGPSGSGHVHEAGHDEPRTEEGELVQPARTEIVPHVQAREGGPVQDAARTLEPIWQAATDGTENLARRTAIVLTPQAGHYTTQETSYAPERIVWTAW